MDISIIIVNWKSKDYLEKCLASIVQQTHRVTYEIIVIDSASFDGSEAMVRKLYPQVKFIQSEVNLGFSGANNTAFVESSGQWLLFLNPDTEVRGDAIDRLFEAAQQLPQAGAVGCKLLNTDGSIQTSCIQSFPTILNQILNAEVLRRFTPRSRLWGMRAIFDFSGQPLEVEMISGACLLMKRNVFEKSGGFSTEYFMYAEDADLCYMARSAGFKNYYVGNAEIVHHGGGSSQQARSNFASVMTIHSISQFLRKSRGAAYSFAYRMTYGFSALLRVAMLVLLSPFLMLRSGVSKWRATCGKWCAILNWGLGRSRWVRDFRRPTPTAS